MCPCSLNATMDRSAQTIWRLGFGLWTREPKHQRSNHAREPQWVSAWYELVMWQVNDDEYETLAEALDALRKVVAEGTIDDWDNLGLENDDAEVVMNGEPTSTVLAMQAEAYDEGTLTVRVYLMAVEDGEPGSYARVPLTEVPELVAAWVEGGYAPPSKWSWFPPETGRLI